MFLYITHNLDFASSRINSQIVWVKEFFVEDGWRYDLLVHQIIINWLCLDLILHQQPALLLDLFHQAYMSSDKQQAHC